eukprot:TRINITY_DN17894_c0_g1_i1.p1 TRINITY_DN17894_c0_g1~~TRINITY_DN17894_c0_g1_i1.p1  ORF type:complete len:180 (+),score=36.16 TRINITY_DN17894_c0_g1_i1:90-629(+)
MSSCCATSQVGREQQQQWSLVEYIGSQLGCGGIREKEDESRKHSEVDDSPKTPGSLVSTTDGCDSPRGLPSKGPSLDVLKAGATFAVTQTTASLVCAAAGAAIGSVVGPGGVAYGAMQGFTVGLAASGTVTPITAAAATIAGAQPAQPPPGKQGSSVLRTSTSSTLLSESVSFSSSSSL